MTALMYHDIVPDGDDDASGFPGRDAALYKLTRARFEEHVRAIAAVPPSSSVLITFDDGGASALAAAETLERYGRRGHFFITADFVGTPGFVDRDAIRELHRRGHVVGSHSCSHPLRMAHCSDAQLQDEWTRSRAVLSDVVGDHVRVASVPGGDFGPNVARAAADAGFALLFTSEPTRRAMRVDGLTVLGRFTIQRWTTAATVAALAVSSPIACARQCVVWNAKKVSKRLGGERYLQLRKLLLRHGDEVKWGDERLKAKG